MDAIRFAAAASGLVVIFVTFYWAARILMVRGADPPWLARLIFRASRNLLHFIGDRMPSANKRRELWALYIPVSLLAILACSIVLATLGFTLLLYGVTQNTMRTAYENSVSSMSTLGIAGQPKTLIETTIGGAEAFTGPIVVALLIAYTVTIYSAYSDYQVQVAAMDEGLGKSRNAVELLVNHLCVSDGAESLVSIWNTWTTEFTGLDRSYRTVDGYLLFFAPEMSKHWAQDGPMVLDAASLRNALVAGEPDESAEACLDSGSIALQHLAQHYTHRVFRIRPQHSREMVDRAQFDYCAQELRNCGVDVVPDQTAAWQAFQTAQDRYATNVATLTRMLPISNKDTRRR